MLALKGQGEKGEWTKADRSCAASASAGWTTLARSSLNLDVSETVHYRGDVVQPLSSKVMPLKATLYILSSIYKIYSGICMPFKFAKSKIQSLKVPSWLSLNSAEADYHLNFFYI